MERFWTQSPSWMLARAVLLGLLAFAALVWLLAPWLAALLAIVVAALSMVDATRAERASRGQEPDQP